MFKFSFSFLAANDIGSKLGSGEDGIWVRTWTSLHIVVTSGDGGG